jgi:hypothetical protein
MDREDLVGNCSNTFPNNEKFDRDIPLTPYWEKIIERLLERNMGCLLYGASVYFQIGSMNFGRETWDGSEFGCLSSFSELRAATMMHATSQAFLADDTSSIELDPDKDNKDTKTFHVHLPTEVSVACAMKRDRSCRVASMMREGGNG